MADKIEMATVSSRGQVCIPNNIRDEMGLKEGSKILFFLSGDDNLLIKKVQTKTFEELTRPLREAIKKSDLKESDVNDIVHRFRTEKRARKENR
jgi:AbrB family looped-hinge helix DNA binding protein